MKEQIDALAEGLIRQIEAKSVEVVEHGLQQAGAPDFVIKRMKPVMLAIMKMGYLDGAGLAIQAAIEMDDLGCSDDLRYPEWVTAEQTQLTQIKDALQMEMMDIQQVLKNHNGNGKYDA